MLNSGLLVHKAINAFRSFQDLIKALQVPAFFTDYCEEAAVMAAGAIALVQKPSLTFPVRCLTFQQYTAE